MINKHLEHVGDSIEKIDSESIDKLANMGLPKSFIDKAMSSWFSNPSGIACFYLDSIHEIVSFDWQEHLISKGYLAIGSCPNGDIIAIKFKDEINLPIVFISHEHDGLYGEGEPVLVDVSSSLKKFLIESDENDNYPWDYFEAKKRIKQ